MAPCRWCFTFRIKRNLTPSLPSLNLAFKKEYFFLVKNMSISSTSSPPNVPTVLSKQADFNQILPLTVVTNLRINGTKKALSCNVSPVITTRSYHSFIASTQESTTVCQIHCFPWHYCILFWFFLTLLQWLIQLVSWICSRLASG